MLRDAASLVLFKKDTGGLRILMGLRHARHKFMPNHMVFPGGRVDAEDYTAELAAPLPQPASQRLLLGASPALALALGHAAARELWEETGLSLGAPPDLSGLDYLCRAETPQHYPIRFNARFFVGEASLASGALAGSGELEALDWYALAQLLELQVPLVTREVLVQLQLWCGLSAADRAARGGLVFHDPVWVPE